MNERVSIIQTKELSKGNQALFSDMIHSPNDQGWHFGWGDPEMWLYKDNLIAPEEKALVLGGGYGRTSLFFALNGMEVLNYETSRSLVRDANRIAKAYQLPLQAKQLDLNKLKLPTEKYHAVVLDEILAHLDSRDQALDVLERAWVATQQEGYIWVKAIGKEDDNYDERLYESNWQIGMLVDNDVFMGTCLRGGEVEEVPFLFLNQLDLLKFFNKNQARVIRSQTIPEYGAVNIMYGEDWPSPDAKIRYNGRISILAQKK